MSWNSKVVWSEGMLLQPQHLQQHDRYIQNQLESRVKGLRPYSWGFSTLKIDEQQLALGKFALLSCEAVLPDGTPVHLPADGDLPISLHVPDEVRDTLVVLALPTRRPGIAEIDNAPAPDNFARYRTAEYTSWDSNGLNNSALMQIGQLRVQLAFESDVENGYTSLGVARILERRADNRLVLDSAYCPPCLDVRAAPQLAGFADELASLLHQRGATVASRLAQPGAAGAAEIVDFLLLQLVNRGEPLFSHLSTMTGLHPENLYCAMVQLAGEMATFSEPGKRAMQYPVYRHDRLCETFMPVIDDLRRSLSLVVDARAVSIILQERQFGIRVAVMSNPELLKSAFFVLAVNAHKLPESIRSCFPKQVKIGAVEKIGELVNRQLPGIGLQPLPVAPHQLPFRSGFTYFELDRASDHWEELTTSAGFAIHVAGDFPGLQMEFWAVRP